MGSLVCQIAKNIYGCTVIGSCGGAEKGALIRDKFGCDYSIDYRTLSTAEELQAKLKEVAPDGIDMYFENVGGFHFEAAFSSLRDHGRIAICGLINSYNEKEIPAFPVKLGAMIYSAQRIEGFVSSPYLQGKKGTFHRDMATWVKEGLINVEETFYDGIEQWPLAFQSLFRGSAANKGKVVVRV